MNISNITWPMHRLNILAGRRGKLAMSLGVVEVPQLHIDPQALMWGMLPHEVLV